MDDSGGESCRYPRRNIKPPDPGTPTASGPISTTVPQPSENLSTFRKRVCNNLIAVAKEEKLCNLKLSLKKKRADASRVKGSDRRTAKTELSDLEAQVKQQERLVKSLKEGSGAFQEKYRNEQRFKTKQRSGQAMEEEADHVAETPMEDSPATCSSQAMAVAELGAPEPVASMSGAVHQVCAALECSGGDLPEGDHQQACYECTEKNPAHSLCTRCNKWLCSTCAEQHRHSKASSEHYLPPRADGSSGSSLFCPIHTQETLKLFCETCDNLMCRHCLVLEHKEHRFRRLEEALQNQRLLLENVITQVEEKKVVVQAAGKQIEDRLYEIKHMHRKVENQIKMTKMVIINELNKRMNSLLEQLEKITSERQQKFEQHLQSVLLLSRQLEHVQNFVNWAMYSKNSIPFLFSKELIIYQMQRLLETSCGGDFGRPLKMKFTWEPSFWTKQISNLGCILSDPVHIPPAGEAPGYGAIDELQPSFYQGLHPTGASHLAAINSAPQSFSATVQCPTTVCCTHCHTLPTVTKSQPVASTLGFGQSGGVKQQAVQPLQYSSGKEQKGLSRPLRVIQPWVSQPPHTEHDSSPYWSESQQQRAAAVQPTVQSVAPICSVTSQDFSHSALPLTTAPSVQMQLGPVHSVGHVPPPQQRHQSQGALCPPDPPQEPPMHHSLDLINQQFELEQMQKGLELLLQSQTPNVQLGHSKPQPPPPQHVQQTIVGQINYIVRQPAPAPLQSQEDVAPVCEDPISPGGPTVDLSPVASHSPQTQSIADEIIAAVEKDACRRIQLSDSPTRKRSASESFSDSPELSPPRLSRSVDPQMPGVSCQFFGQPADRCFPAEPERMAPYALVEAAVPENLQLESSDHLATGGALLGSTICKIESENFSCGGPAAGAPMGSEGVAALSDMVLPLDAIFDEPINLSVKRCLPAEPALAAPRKPGTPPLPPPPPPPPPPASAIKEADVDLCSLALVPGSQNRFQQQLTDSAKIPENPPRPEPKETKIPYVRLERLNLSPPNSGELPVFKVQPKKKDEEGSLRLLIKYGARSKSMSIKVNSENPSSTSTSASTEISPQPPIPYGIGTDPLPLPAPIPAPPPAHKPHPFPRIHSYTGGTQEVTHLVEHIEEQSQEPLEPLCLKKTECSSIHIENEDFCAVCLNGGEMLCCDHCPKVFHLSCHVPTLLSFPVGEWVCTLCRNINKPEVEYDCDNVRYSRDNKIEDGMLPHLDPCDQRKCEKLVMALYCNSLSVPFQEPVSPLARHYYQIIKRPMDLSIIRKKLQKRNIPHYSTPEELVFDIRLMFWNCAKFNYEDSEVAEAGRNLEVIFEDLLKDAYPNRVFPFPQDDESETEEIGAEHCPVKEFHWPSYGQECLQPKRRRRHAVHPKPKDFSLC
ncbi:tripartite motif-containing protein 66 [Gastrophryne carolinensis]